MHTHTHTHTHKHKHKSTRANARMHAHLLTSTCLKIDAIQLKNTHRTKSFCKHQFQSQYYQMQIILVVKGGNPSPPQNVGFNPIDQSLRGGGQNVQLVGVVHEGAQNTCSHLQTVSEHRNQM